MLRLIDQNHVDVVLADTPSREQLADWRTRHGETAFVVLVDGTDEEDSLDALYAGARAILPRSAERNEIVAAIKAVTNGLVVLPRELLADAAQRRLGMLMSCSMAMTQSAHG